MGDACVFSDSHYLLVLVGEHAVNFLDELVVALLQLLLCVFLLVLCETVLDSFLQDILILASYFAHSDLGFLADCVTLLGKLAASLLCRDRDAQAYYLTVVVRCDAEV